MPLILPGNVGSATAATGYNVANSCRFNDDDSAYMHFTPGSGNRRTFTISMWVKRAKLGEAYLWGINNGTNPYTQIVFDANDKLYINDYNGSEDTQLITTQTFRDVAAWYHIVIAYDTTQSTAANRVKLYINGTRVTSFATETYPAQNFDTEWNNGVQQDLGKFSTSYGDYYLAEVCMVEDSQLAPDQFGEFDSDSGIWKPIDVSGLTFNTEGFYLDFEDSGDLGDDESGNGNDFTEVNLAATDQSTDTCTNNFATMNPLDNFHQGTAFSEGNLKLVYTSGNRTWNTCNVALSSGKWYCEILKGETNNDKIGIHYKLSAGLTDRADSDGGAWSYLGGKNADDGGVKTGGSTITYTIAPSDSGDIVGIFLDLDNNKLYFSVNGTVAHSGVGIDIPAASTLENGHYYIFGGSSNTSETMTHTWNFGSPAVALSSGVTDANGFGNFEYTPSGTFDSASKDFLAICTKKPSGEFIMADYTAINDPSAFFQIALYSGTGSQQSITNDGNSDLQPDWLWIKERDGTSSHQLVDSVRLYYNRLESDNASAELDAGQTGATNQNVTSFDSDGFGVKNGAAVNESGKTYVAWQWKAGTTASGTTGGSGTGKSYSYSANTTSGFSVVTYTGNATAGHLIPHGMSKVPRLIHVKSRGDDNGWVSGTIVSASAWNDHGYLYLNNAFGTDANQFGATPDSTNFRLGTGTGTNGNNGTRVAYCFADVQGYQKIGKYVGNGNANGTFVYCGFKPAYVIAKNLDAAKSWFIYDNKRDPFNPTVEKLRADTSAAEATGTDKLIDMYSNGFKIRTDDAEFNTSGANYLFHAIAENPFVTSTGVPTTAR